MPLEKAPLAFHSLKKINVLTIVEVGDCYFIAVLHAYNKEKCVSVQKSIK